MCPRESIYPYHFKEENVKPVVVAHAIIPTLERPRQEDYPKSIVSLENITTVRGNETEPQVLTHMNLQVKLLRNSYKTCDSTHVRPRQAKRNRVLLVMAGSGTS